MIEKTPLMAEDQRVNVTNVNISFKRMYMLCLKGMLALILAYLTLFAPILLIALIVGVFN